MNPIYHTQLSANFSASEFRCRGDEEGKPCACHGAVLVDGKLVQVLQAFREYVGTPLILTSAFRCDLYNEAVGGHVRSFHRVGKAADVTSIQLRKDLEGMAHDLGEIVQDLLGDGFGNVIWYGRRHFIHVDAGHRIAELVRSKE